MNFFVVLGRAGRRVSVRRRQRTRLGNNQQVSKEEAMEWFKTQFDGMVLN